LKTKGFLSTFGIILTNNPLRQIPLIFFLLLTALLVRAQNPPAAENLPKAEQAAAEGKYLHYQRLLQLKDDSVKCAKLIAYAEKISDSLGNYNFALLIFEKANDLLHQRKFVSDSRDTDNLGRLMPLLYSKWARCLQSKGDCETADRLYSKALGYTDILNSDLSFKAYILNNAGANLGKMMVYKRALSYCDQALELYTKLNDEKGKATVYANMANIFVLTENYGQSSIFFDKAAKIYLQNKQMARYAAVLGNKAVVAIRLGKLREAMTLFHQVLKLNPPENNELYIRTCFNMGMLYSDLKQWDSCFYFLDKGKAVSDSLNLSKRWNGTYYYDMAQCYADKNETNKAIAFYKLALKNKTGVTSYRTLYDDISKLYFKQKQYDSAFTYKNESMRIADSIYKSELGEHISFENKRIELLEKDYQNQIRETQQQQFLDNLQKRNFMLLCSVVMLITLVLLLFLYFKQYRLKVKKEQLQSELDFLKAQLNPHFLFNSLNNIYVLLEEDKEKALELLVQFCELMRYQLYDCDVSSILLSDEIRFLENYVDFEKLRYEGKINVEHNLKESVTGDFQIAPILLQPFIENAFKHSPKNRHNPSQISIRTALTKADFLLEVKNSVNMKEHSTLPGGIGLENVKKRLKLLYPNKHELKINSTDASFQIKLKIALSND
jgi:tetratricopeptide (TPR) repeat protein